MKESNLGMKLRLLFSCAFLENSYFAQRKNISYEIRFLGYWIYVQTLQTKKHILYKNVENLRKFYEKLKNTQ